MEKVRARHRAGAIARARRLTTTFAVMVAAATLVAGCSWITGLFGTSGRGAGTGAGSGTGTGTGSGTGGVVAGGNPGGGVIAPPAQMPEFVVEPPTVLEVLLELKQPHQSRARIFVRYEPDPRLRPAIPLFLEGGLTVIRDDGTNGDEIAGDRLYTGDYKVELAALEERQQRFDDLAADQGGVLMTPDFDGRTKVGDVPLPRLEIEQLLGGSRIKFPAQWGLPVMISREKSLLINDVRVVNDPTRTKLGCPTPPAGSTTGTPLGVWTVGRLMTLLAGGSAQAPQFINSWLSHWRSDVTVDGVVVAKRPHPEALTNAWGNPVDPAKAPFRLLAIVNRFDLAGNVAYGGGSAGEVRLVFGLLKSPCAPADFTLIFEYGVSVPGCQQFRAWVQRWRDLASYDLSNPTDLTSYGNDLAALVEEVVNPQPGGISAQLNRGIL